MLRELWYFQYNFKPIAYNQLLASYILTAAPTARAGVDIDLFSLMLIVDVDLSILVHIYSAFLSSREEQYLFCVGGLMPYIVY